MEANVPFRRGSESVRPGREPSFKKPRCEGDERYVLLLHIGGFDAHMLPRLLRLYRQSGFSFVSLEHAEQDPFYQYDMNLRLLPGPDLLENAMRDKHLPLPRKADSSRQLEAICQ